MNPGAPFIVVTDADVLVRLRIEPCSNWALACSAVMLAAHSVKLNTA
jgi:hypothetical protein